MKQLQFFRCRHCGNISVLPVASGVPLFCCGEKMELLVPNSKEAAVEKHIPEVKVNADTIDVQIGSVIHPMTEEHHIAFIAVEYADGSYTVKPLEHTDSPVYSFAVKGASPVRVYEFCNLHGLWVKEI